METKSSRGVRRLTGKSEPPVAPPTSDGGASEIAAATPNSSAACAQSSVCGEEWLFVALMYSTPWRPTYLRMVRDRSGDRPGCIGLQAARGCKKAALASWLTVREALGDVIGIACKTLRASWHTLHADGRRVAKLRAWKQRVLESLVYSCPSLWAITPPPPRPR